MLRANPKKIKLARRLWPLALILLLVVAFYGYRLGSFFFSGHDSGQPKLLIGSSVYSLELANTAATQEKGLSDRFSMPNNRGMLFDFGSESERCMWMKDMHFPLDMIWADSSKKVTAVNMNVAASSYPTTYCKNAQYVVELNAGALYVHGKSRISVGDRLQLR